MCGIVGVCNLHGDPVPAGLLKRMTDIIAHRGPDGEGHYTDGPIGLGHRRLAIIDLSPAGRQPMANAPGDVIITYNGEIYNFQELRIELEALGYQFHSRTDTEVVLRAYEHWGENCVSHFNGMFAFAIYDRRSQVAGRGGRILLARDRFGIKPLYWYCRDDLFIFASEIKAILAHPQVRASLCYPALNEYFTFQNIFTDLTLFDGVRLLPPASTLSLHAGERAKPTVKQYWDYPCEPAADKVSVDEWAERVRRGFVAAVRRQLVSDVPVGAYLSGGMDSGSITSVAARHLSRLTTFTAGFDLSSASGLELGCDERLDAEVMANAFKTEHYEVVLHAGDMEWILPELVWHLEDLRVGQSYPNYYAARLASKFVKVVLSGAGGDELFGGYPWRYYRGLTGHGRDSYFRNYYDFWQRLVPEEDKSQLFTADVRRQLGGHSTFEVFRDVFRGWEREPRSPEDQVSASLYFELKTFLPGLFVVEDKLSMAHSLETRVPFLDNNLVDLATRIPVHHKLRDLVPRPPVDENMTAKHEQYELRADGGKAVLRQAMCSLLPAEVVQRKKQGFTAPDAAWFRGESIDYINRLLGSRKAMIYDFLEPNYVARVLDDHCSGRANRRLLIWSLLNFEWWCRHFLLGSSTTSRWGRDSAMVDASRRIPVAPQGDRVRA